jgi:hypothetical protein
LLHHTQSISISFDWIYKRRKKLLGRIVLTTICVNHDGDDDDEDDENHILKLEFHHTIKLMQH